MRGIAFGILIGALTATSAVPRLQWLNLARTGWWGRPVLAALLAGALVGAFHQGGTRAAAIAGSVAAVVALWGVYGIMRLSVQVLWVERSAVRVIAFDLLRLAAYAIPAGGLGALAATGARVGVGGLMSGRPR